MFYSFEVKLFPVSELVGFWSDKKERKKHEIMDDIWRAHSLICKHEGHGCRDLIEAAMPSCIF